MVIEYTHLQCYCAAAYLVAALRASTSPIQLETKSQKKPKLRQGFNKFNALHSSFCRFGEKIIKSRKHYMLWFEFEQNQR